MDPSCQIIVALEPGPTAADRLAAALGAARIATVIIRPSAGQNLDASSARRLVEIAQGCDVAALIEGDPNLARALRADGVHLAASDTIAAAYAEAREVLGTRYIVGADAGASRHEAMSLGEAGADYVSFGIVSPAADDAGSAIARARRADLIAWWAPIFEVPCVALDVETVDEVSALAEAGADFVVVALPTAMAPADVAAHVARLAAAVAEGSATRSTLT